MKASNREKYLSWDKTNIFISSVCSNQIYTENIQEEILQKQEWANWKQEK